MPLVNVRFAARCLAAVLLLVTAISLSAQSTGGRILGRVSDPSGAVLAGVKITLTNQATGVQRTGETNANGDYGFVEVAPGQYSLEFNQAGFKKNIRNGVTVDINQVVTLNSSMELGQAQEVVEVTSEAPLVETTSTQLGAVVNERAVNELPLNQRDAYQFLQLQPGVQSQLGGSGGLFYGADNAGSVSVNGGRTRANNFSVNGGDANDQFVNLPTVQPSPDSIQEFRVISNTFDAEYGRNSGAVVNVVTKSGTNAFHGDVYEYFRNKVLNAQGYLNTVKPQFNQNQFGGTFGGPLIKDRTFFFASYEGRRIRQGQPSDPVLVPTSDERNGIFAGGFGGGFDPNLYGFVGQVLDGRPGCDNALGIPSVLALPPDPTTGLINWSSVFPTGTIPGACQDPVATDLLRFMPAANAQNGTAYQAVPSGRNRQDQFTFRFDHRINDRQNFTGYYYFTDGSSFQPFSFFQAAGANLPGFGSNVNERFQQVNLTHNWTISNAIVNEAHITYMREGQLTFQHPEHNNLVTDSCSAANAQNVCFNGASDSSAINALPGSGPKFGITPNLPANREGVPFVSVSGGGVFGNNFEGELPQAGNTYQASDSLTWVKGNHTMKFGGDVRYNQFNQTLYFAVNGDFTFNSTGPNAVLYGDNYPGYLLGLTDQYLQGSAQVERVRSTGVYLFAQDSWKLKPNLTLNYGLRWELNTPLTDISQHIQTFRPGQTSSIYPCQLSQVSIQYFQSQYGVANPTCANTGVNPTGLLVPGDKGVPAALTSTYYKAVAPRIGLAYSPSFNDGVLKKVFGGNGRTSIRAGWGLFYNPVEQLVLEQFSAEPPFGGSSLLFNTFFNTPFVNQGGFTSPNPFNGILNPPRNQPVDWSLFRPILLYGEFQPHLRAQYSAQYNFGVQRELSRDMVLQLNYVGSQGHRQLASHDINPANPQTCLDIISIANANPGNVTSYGAPGTCGQYLEDNQFSVTVPNGMNFHMPNGSTLAGTGQTLQFVGIRPYSSPSCDPFTGNGCPPDGTPVFTNVFAEDTVANSAYNSFQASLEKRFSHGLQLQAAYTWSKSLDQASSFEETLNPFNFRSSRALSLFNSAQRFVINYYWELPIPKHDGVLGKLVNDWAVSGITEFQSGFPIRIQTQNDNELISSLFFIGTAAPQLTGTLQKLNPKSSSGHYYLNANQFSDPALGTFATTPRSICCGPGLNNWDVSVLKKILISESKYFQFRADIFNLANHTQFYNPDGNFSDGPNFGRVTQTHDPRLVQFALKFFF